MIYLLYHRDDLEKVKKKIVPLLGDREKELIEFPFNLNFQPDENSVFITYLSDFFLREFLPAAAKNNWETGILPHPNLKHVIKGLGISGKLKEALNEILNTEESQKLDLLCCNETPVFQAVNIGEVFILNQESNKTSFTSEIVTFLKNIKKLPSLHHKAFTLSTGDEKIIYTSALGIVVVEHPLSSIVSKRIITNSAMNDGMFNVLVIAPQNILELLWFLGRSLLPNKSLEELPSFIGRIKVAEFKIENEKEIEYTIDGEEKKAKVIEFKVQHEALVLKQASIYQTEKKGAIGKKSMKIDRLPKGEKREELTRRKLPLFPRATTEEFLGLFRVLRENAKVSSTFLVMMILSTLIATFGLFANSSPVIIGAMILAPIITPIVAFSMGMVRNDMPLLNTGLKTITVGTISALFFAAALSLFVPLKIITPEIFSRLSPNLLDLGIAIASGIAAAYAHSKKEIAKSLAGVAIAVALVPPLAVSGIGIGWWNWEVFSGAFLLYLTNLSGIIMFAGITFLVLGFAPFTRAKLGLSSIFLVLIIVSIPLYFSFNRIRHESNVVRLLEGSTYGHVTLKDVNVRYGEPLIISLRMVSPENIDDMEIGNIKRKIEEKINKPVIIEIVSARQFGKNSRQ